MGRYMRNPQMPQPSRKKASPIMAFLQNLAKSCRDGQDIQTLFSNCKILMVTSFELIPAPIDPVAVVRRYVLYTLLSTPSKRHP